MNKSSEGEGRVEVKMRTKRTEVIARAPTSAWSVSGHGNRAKRPNRCSESRAAEQSAN
jgi:hypothetical protein